MFCTWTEGERCRDHRNIDIEGVKQCRLCQPRGGASPCDFATHLPPPALSLESRLRAWRGVDAFSGYWVLTLEDIVVAATAGPSSRSGTATWLINWLGQTWRHHEPNLWTPVTLDEYRRGVDRLGARIEPVQAKPAAPAYTMGAVPLGAIAVYRKMKGVKQSVIVERSADGYSYVGNSTKYPDHMPIIDWYYAHDFEKAKRYSHQEAQDASSSQV